MTRDGGARTSGHLRENRWTDADHATAYLARRDRIPHRGEGYDVLIELLPERVTRVLDLGTGDGHALALVLDARPGAQAVGVDFSAEMLARARGRFVANADVDIVEHDLDAPLPGSLGVFDAVVSAFAVHHVDDDRKRALYGEVHDRLVPGGLFANLEHVDSPTASLHLEFLRTIGTDPADDDPSNRLAPVDAQLEWMRAAGFVDVDCFWKWRELALLAGTRPDAR